MQKPLVMALLSSHLEVESSRPPTTEPAKHISEIPKPKGANLEAAASERNAKSRPYLLSDISLHWMGNVCGH